MCIRDSNTSVPATVVQSLKAEACANAIQIHTAVRADTQAPKAVGPAQRGSTANEAPADQRSPLSQWPPSTVDACRVTPLTSTGPRQWKRADPQGESRQSHHPEAGHCCPDRTNGGHPPEPPIWGTASDSPSGPKSVLRCVADTPPPRALGQRPPPTVPRRKVPWAHTAAGPTWTDQQPLPADLLLQRSVVDWIDTVQGCP